MCARTRACTCVKKTGERKEGGEEREEKGRGEEEKADTMPLIVRVDEMSGV